MPLPKANGARIGIHDQNKIIGIHKGVTFAKQNDSKRMADCSVDEGPNRKRSVLGDLTNNTISEKVVNKGKLSEPVKSINNVLPVKPHVLPPKQEVRKSKRLSEKQEKHSVDIQEKLPVEIPEKLPVEMTENSFSSAKDCSPDCNETTFETPTAEPDSITINPVKNDNEAVVPEGVQDFDKEMENELFSVSIYAQDIFRHFKEREVKFKIDKYLDSHKDISRNMRAILVDWMVEIQESFELNHETLYLAVKLVDMYLSRVKSFPKLDLQLLASTALLIAAKFDERCTPCIDDFVYICDGAYTNNQIIRTEIKILKCVDFDLGIPLSYTFLRRYARCTKQTMELLTLARYILELSLMEYNLIDLLESRLAAAALSLALQMTKAEHWNKTLEFYSGYTLDQISDLKVQLNALVKKAPTVDGNGNTIIFSKYSHKIFFEVAKIPAVEDFGSS